MRCQHDISFTSTRTTSEWLRSIGVKYALSPMGPALEYLLSRCAASPACPARRSSGSHLAPMILPWLWHSSRLCPVSRLCTFVDTRSYHPALPRQIHFVACPRPCRSSDHRESLLSWMTVGPQDQRGHCRPTLRSAIQTRRLLVLCDPYRHGRKRVR